jgi:hypothetical protein
VADAAHRLDVRERTKLAAIQEVAMHDTYLALVSGPLVRELAEWSEPMTVQVRMVPDENGMVEIEVRRVEV